MPGGEKAENQVFLWKSCNLSCGCFFYGGEIFVLIIFSKQEVKGFANMKMCKSFSVIIA